MKQGGADWHAARAGKITCSRLGAILELDPYCKPRQYWEELVGLRAPFAGNAATVWGQAHEPVARDAYEAEHGVLLNLCGFVCHPDIAWFGGSPDALADDLVVEFKAPYAGRFPDEPPPRYLAQCQGLMQVTGKAHAHLYYWINRQTRRFDIARSEEFWAKALPTICEFYQRVKDKQWASNTTPSPSSATSKTAKSASATSNAASFSTAPKV